MLARPLRRAAAVLALSAANLATGACSTPGRSGPPAPGWASGPPLSLDGRRILVMPVQTVRGVAGDVDAELAFGLETRGERVEWILPGQLRDALARSPGLRANPGALPVSMFLQAEVRRIGDPLYGEIRRMAELTDAVAAFLPVAVRARPATDSVPAGVEIVAALVDARTGRVLWSGVSEGVGAPGSPGTLATAVDAIAVAMLGTTDDRRVEPAEPASPGDGVDDDATQDPDGAGRIPGGRPHDDGPDGLRRHRAADAHGAAGRGLLHLFR